MARSEIIENVGRHGPFDPYSCCMELRGAIHLCSKHYLQVLYPGRVQRARTRPLTVLLAASPAPLFHLCHERGEDMASPGSSSDSEREKYEDAWSHQEPLPDLLPRNESSTWALPQHRAPRGLMGQELKDQRVAYKLRLIGDQFNTALLHRGHLGPPRPLWRHELRGVLYFISQTLSTFYRLM